MKLCLRTIHQEKLGGDLDSCAAHVLSRLLQVPTTKVKELIEARRKRLHWRGILKQYEHYQAESWCVDWREIVGLLREIQPNVRSRVCKKKTSLIRFGMRTFRHDKTYVVMIDEHVLILRGGRVYDNITHAGNLAYYDWWRYPVLNYAVLNN